MENPDHRELVDHLFRHERGRMVAVLTRIFGFRQLELVEDVVQESFLSALRAWRERIPDNPPAWLMQVAKNRAIDALRRGKLEISPEKGQDPTAVAVAAAELFHEREIADSQLRLVFACCHPVLQLGDQIAFTLQLASGFSVREIARALLTAEETIKKRLQRARKRIKDSNIRLQIPDGPDLNRRVDAVLQVLYLTFNEGYHSTSSETVIRRDLCAEAMRLTKIVCEHPAIDSADANALLALMCYHAARFDSRLGPNNEVVLLADQDRSLWDMELARVGNRYLARTNTEAEPTVYLVEAAIAAQHVFAPSIDATPWSHLRTLYDVLHILKPTPVVWLNRAVVVAESGDAVRALTDLQRLGEGDFRGHEHLYHTVSARVHELCGDVNGARTHLHRALSTAPSESERLVVKEKLDELERKTT